MSILVVDDHPSGRELAVEALRPLGYELIEADSADIALQLALAEQPALILLDIRMPSADGFSAIHALRNNATTANIRIVAFTACAMRDEKLAAMEAGFDGCITKPITIAALREEVLRYLSPGTPDEVRDFETGDTPQQVEHDDDHCGDRDRVGRVRRGRHRFRHLSDPPGGQGRFHRGASG